MLNIKGLSQLLTRNTIPELYSTIYIFSLTGSILAYSTPSDTRALRDQLALLLISWNENSSSSSSDSSSTSSKHSSLKTLILESDTRNVVARRLNGTYVLVIVGRGEAPPRAALQDGAEPGDVANEIDTAGGSASAGEPVRAPARGMKTSFEYDGDARYPPVLPDEDARLNALMERLRGEGEEEAGYGGGNGEITALLLQRRKAESLVEVLNSALGDAGAVEDGEHMRMFM